MNDHQKISELLAKSNLQTDQINELLVIFGSFPDEQLQVVSELLEKDISWAEKLHKNYSDKKQAIENMDDKKWQEIIDEETKLLENLD